MEEIIPSVGIEALEQELSPDKKLCDTNRGGNEIYVIDAHTAPNVMREIGRLRELSFREAGGGSGLSMDIDGFDTMENPYRQIVIWNPDAREILGGYRYILGPDVKLKPDGQPNLATSHMFHFSDKFIRNYLPYSIELGRSFVRPEYQSSRNGARSLYTMDNLWDGIHSVLMQHSDITYLFGKMTMYPQYDRYCRDLILRFLWKHFPDPDELVRPCDAVLPVTDTRHLDSILKSDGFEEDYRNLKAAVRERGTNIPPLVNSYMKMSPTMKMFGTAVNHEFSEVEETGIMICLNDMYPEKKDRHYNKSLLSLDSQAK